jgi:hypothetical protein
VSEETGPKEFEYIEAILQNEEIYALGEAIPTPPKHHGGRPRQYPGYMVIAFGVLRDVYDSARQAAAEMSDPEVWDRIRSFLRGRFGYEFVQHPPAKPIKRHHWLYMDERYLTDPEVKAAMRRIHEEISCLQALEAGLCDPAGGGSLNHPAESRCLYGDGKVVKPLYKTEKPKTVVDQKTGKTRQVRRDPDAEHHVVGSGEPAFGNKFVFVNVRGEHSHERFILSYDHVAGGNEAGVAVDCLKRVLPRLPGAQAVIYDGAFRGMHIDDLVRSHGVVVIAPVAAKSGGKKSRSKRVEQDWPLGEGLVVFSDGTSQRCQLYTRAGALHMADLSEDGRPIFTPLKRIKLERRGQDNQYRLYGVWSVPGTKGTVRQELYNTHEDRKRRLNRTEHLRPIPPDDPDYERLYPLRGDAESINRGFDDHRYLRRAHSVGRHRQTVDALMHAVMVNSLAIARARARRPDAQLPLFAA